MTCHVIPTNERGKLGDFVVAEVESADGGDLVETLWNSRQLVVGKIDVCPQTHECHCSNHKHITSRQTSRITTMMRPAVELCTL